MPTRDPFNTVKAQEIRDILQLRPIDGKKNLYRRAIQLEIQEYLGVDQLKAKEIYSAAMGCCYSYHAWHAGNYNMSNLHEYYQANIMGPIESLVYNSTGPIAYMCKIASFLQQVEDVDTILDWAGGAGEYSMVAAAMGKAVTYYEFPGNAEKFFRWRLEVRGMTGQIEVKTELDDTRYDCVICMETLEHLVDPFAEALEGMMGTKYLILTWTFADYEKVPSHLHRGENMGHQIMDYLRDNGYELMYKDFTNCLKIMRLKQ